MYIYCPRMVFCILLTLYSSITFRSNSCPHLWLHLCCTVIEPAPLFPRILIGRCALALWGQIIISPDSLHVQLNVDRLILKTTGVCLGNVLSKCLNPCGQGHRNHVTISLYWGCIDKIICTSDYKCDPTPVTLWGWELLQARWAGRPVKDAQTPPQACSEIPALPPKRYTPRRLLGSSSWNEGLSGKRTESTELRVFYKLLLW